MYVPEFLTPQKMEAKHTHASILLGTLSKIGTISRVVELGSGNGVVLVIIAKLNPVKELIGIEINERSCEVARKIVEMNGLKERIKIINADVRDASKILGYESVDCVVFNPPFHNDGKKSKESERFLERNVDDFEDFVVAAKSILKYGHEFFAITSPKNLILDVNVFVKHNMTPKSITPIYGKLGVDSKMIFVEGKKGGKMGGFKLHSPIMLDDF
ncbi:methyltransferase [Athalassotoga saccharophila]|uniref:methyltransferase n=1 Tax=Athalassotoga saccharophila TaxID=1441386 RepID=UPI0013793F4F|nr:methyltransferase [Athalassotoga saccharophila]BBJ27523.1 tRNA1(Val) (adenine(37)-N6)-methyltransferase [Athalassotoga saccharophila]